MDRDSTFREISAIARSNPSACLWALGYLSVGLPTETLEDLLAGLREFQGSYTQPSHSQAFFERWGTVPGSRPAN